SMPGSPWIPIPTSISPSSSSKPALPASGKAGFELEEGEMEVGIGIHGEPGIERKPVARADAIAEELTGKVLSDLDFSGSDVAVMVNGMGATPEMELFLINKKVQSILHDK